MFRRHAHRAKVRWYFRRGRRAHPQCRAPGDLGAQGGARRGGGGLGHGRRDQSPAQDDERDRPASEPAGAGRSRLHRRAGPGRGGSDTTAVALAAALKADACEIYTDVDGVYTTDPRVCERARKLQRISYEEMLELASLGSKVLQIRSVEFAMKYKVPLWVKSSFTGDPGTLVCEEDAAVEDVQVGGMA